MGFYLICCWRCWTRIVLKSGLLPVRIPTRKFTIVGKTKTIKNKLITITMNKFKFFSVALLASAFASQAQDINQAKRLSMQSNLKVLNRS
jgi:hypothetical protein